MNTLFKIIKDEVILVRLKTKSDVGFWQYQFFGLLSLFMNRGNDYLIITDKRIILSIKESVKVNERYLDFSSIKINTKKDTIYYTDKNNQLNSISLAQLVLDYEDYQYLKKKLNTSES